MHKIYLEKRCIIICSPSEQALGDPNAIRFSLGETSGIHDLINLFEQSGSLLRIYIPTDDIENTYRKICSEFKEVNAGGGLVSNRRGDFLLISRNGFWDLPKGHQEQGEDIRTTALREVREETGVDQLELRADGRRHNQGRMGGKIEPPAVPHQDISVHCRSIQGSQNLNFSLCSETIF